MRTRTPTPLLTTAITLLALLLTAAPAAARTWIVRPGASIQAIIDQAAPGDTILILPGEYHEHLSIIDKSLTLRSVAGAAATTLVLLDNPDDFTEVGMNIRSATGGSSLHGLTLRTPSTSPPHTAMLLEADLEISDCVIGPVELFAILGGPRLNELTIVDTSFADCPNAIRAAADLDIRGCSFTRCGVAVGARGNHCNGGSATISRCRFEDCLSAVDLPFDEIDVADCESLRCRSVIRAVSVCGSLSVTGSRFLDSGPEPAVFSQRETTVEDSAFIGGSGFRTTAAILIDSDDAVAVRRCLFQDLEGARRGVGIEATGAPIEVDACRFVENDSISAGGIVRLSQRGAAEGIRVHDCEFVGNTSRSSALGISGSDPLVSVSQCGFTVHIGPLLGVSSSLAPGSEVSGCRFLDSQTEFAELITAPTIAFRACDFEANTAEATVVIRAGSLAACRFLANTADSALVIADSITNCEFVGNTGSVAQPRGDIRGSTFSYHASLASSSFAASGCILRDLDAPITRGRGHSVLKHRRGLHRARRRRQHRHRPPLPPKP